MIWIEALPLSFLILKNLFQKFAINLGGIALKLRAKCPTQLPVMDFISW